MLIIKHNKLGKNLAPICAVEVEFAR